jgi:hypothetical protein
VSVLPQVRDALLALQHSFARLPGLVADGRDMGTVVFPTAALKIFLTALAIADDLGAIVVIAVFYTKQLSLAYLFVALGIFAILGCLNRLRVMTLWPYMIGGVVMWWFFLQSGVHATIGGVLLAFAVPFAREEDDCVSRRLQHRLHYPVALGILPVFALVNTCIPLHGDWYWQLLNRVDIALDSFPCTGLTVSAIAAWMGIPTVTVAGDSPISRAGTALAHAIGLESWVAEDQEGYISIAAAAARDLDALASLRASMRQRMQLKLTDGKRFTRSYERALREAWSRWCATP